MQFVHYTSVEASRFSYFSVKKVAAQLAAGPIHFVVILSILDDREATLASQLSLILIDDHNHVGSQMIFQSIH